MLVVLGQHGRVAVAQPQRRRAFPVVVEAADVGQLVAQPALGDVGQRAAGADGGELARVADQQQLRPRGLAAPLDLGEVVGAGHVGLVDHHQVPAPQPPRLVPSAHRARRCRAGAAHRARRWCSPPRSALPRRAPRRPPGTGRARTPVARVPSTGAGPGVGERADDERLAGAGRGAQHLDLRAGGEHPAHGGGLVRPERPAGGGEPVEQLAGPRARTAGRRRAAPRRRAAGSRRRAARRWRSGPTPGRANTEWPLASRSSSGSSSSSGSGVSRVARSTAASVSPSSSGSTCSGAMSRCPGRASETALSRS